MCERANERADRRQSAMAESHRDSRLEDHDLTDVSLGSPRWFRPEPDDA
jgi:hypothetical protein